ncbi:unnamed protein product [Lepeophtheirus salmonis]|uniref:(salmon louse) hypothetical protein n=1 Tax=Lepeophtheirus salmonis TaxID=72036 RepID=A0A7R8HA81_LEPSM|nr:unnamed protein product [Lepeophtheirus salmonis]CAF2968232.1 unnamed protein product [Lepeophtheirus salmonis]
MPSRQTVDRWIEGFNVVAGIQNDCLRILHEMSLNFENEADCFGAFSLLKILYIFKFHAAMRKARLFEIINEIEVYGIKIFVVIFDLGNKTFQSQLGLLKLGQFTFPTPHDPSRPIFGFPDIPHLTKLARNHILEKGYIIPIGCFGLHIEEQLAILDDMFYFMKPMQLDDLTLPTCTVDDRNSNEYVEHKEKNVRLFEDNDHPDPEGSDDFEMADNLNPSILLLTDWSAKVPRNGLWFIAWKFKIIHSHLGTYNYKIDDKWSTQTPWIFHLSRGGLLASSDAFLSDVAIYEEVFCDIHKEKVDKNPQV